jgi:hypothetical protein
MLTMFVKRLSPTTGEELNQHSKLQNVFASHCNSVLIKFRDGGFTDKFRKHSDEFLEVYSRLIRTVKQPSARL